MCLGTMRNVETGLGLLRKAQIFFVIHGQEKHNTRLSLWEPLLGAPCECSTE